MINLPVTNVYIFDLDHTVIDSEHRIAQAMKPNGDLCLTKYRQGQTKENIFKDTLLPLCKVMLHLIEQGEQVVICTARALTKSDYHFLKVHGLKVPLILSRDQLPRRFGNAASRKIWQMGDGEYKWQWLHWLKSYYKGACKFTLYDDHPEVLRQARTLGVQTFDAIAVNELLTLFLDVGYEAGYADGVADIEAVMGSIETIIQFEEAEAC